MRYFSEWASADNVLSLNLHSIKEDSNMNESEEISEIIKKHGSFIMSEESCIDLKRSGSQVLENEDPFK